MPQRIFHQQYQDRNLYQGADDGSESLAGTDTEHGNGYSDGQLEIITCGCECYRSGFVVRHPHPSGEPEGGEKHDGKI